MANIFVDQSAANNGDGTSAAQASTPGGAGAYNTFASVSPNVGDVVWIRRTAATVLLTAGRTLSVAGVAYIGWPVTGDPDYAARPASGTSAGWDSDSATWAELKTTTVLTTTYFVLTGSGTRLERLKLTEAFNSATSSTATVDVQTAASLNNCYLLYSGTSSLAHESLTGTTGTPVVKVSNTTGEFSGVLSGTGVFANFNGGAAVGDWEFINVTFTQSNASSTNTYSRVVYAASSTASTWSFVGCTFTRAYTTSSYNAVDFAGLTNTSNVAMYDCTIADSSTAAATQLNTNPGQFVGQRIKMTSGRRVNITAAGQYVHFSTLTQTVASSDYCVNLVAGATFVCNNFHEAVGNTSGAINGTVAADILLQNTSLQSANPYGAPASQLANIWVADDGGTYGNWKFIGRRGTITAQATCRTGGESYSLKYNMTSGSQNYLGFLQGILNGFETLLAAVTTASTTITIYGAHKGYSPAPDASQIWADCDYLDQASGSRRAFGSTRGNPGVALTSDDSTWTGDTGLTPFKLVIPVAALQNCFAPIRLFDNLRQASAYFYIDPRPVVA